MNNLKVGFNRVNITPMLGIKVAGYYQTRISDGVLDQLEANTVAFEVDGKRAVVVSADIIALRAEVAQALKESIVKTTGLDSDAIYLCATHTHTGPILASDSTDPLEQEYFTFFCHRITDSVRMAFSDLKDSKLGYAVGHAPNVAFVRRYRMKDGSIKTNPGVDNPDILEPAGAVDERVNVIRIDRDGADTVVIANFGNHPDVVGGCKISADWPGFFRRTFEKAVDGVKCVFINGAQGDVNHVNVHPRGGDLNDMFIDFDDVARGYSHSEHIGRVVAAGVLQVYGKVKYIDIDSINYGIRNVRIPSARPTAEELPEAKRIHELHTTGRDSEIPFKGMMLTTVVAEAARMVRLENGPDYFDMYVSALRVGPLAFVGLPGEPFTGIGTSIKDTKGFDLILPSCNTNASEGYFPMQEAYDEGGYEARSSRFKAGVAELLIDGAKELLRGI